MAKNGTIEDAAHEERRRIHKAVNCSLTKVSLGVIAICFVINLLESFSSLETSAIKGHCILKSNATEESNGFDIVEATNSGTTRKDNNKPIAIVHVGPYKTGTTSIQSSLRENINLFQSENIYLPGISPNLGDIYYWSNCLTRQKKGTWSLEPCYPDSLREEKASIRTTQYFGHNVIVSSESLSAPIIDLDQLEKLLIGYEVHVIVVYRRFASQLISDYGQALVENDKNHGIDWKGADILEEKGFLNMSQALRNKIKWTTSIHASTVVDRYDKRFNVSVINMHDSADTIEAFYCNDRVRMITDACSEYRNGRMKAAVNTNMARTRDYDMIAIAARRFGLLNGRQISRFDATMAIQKHYEKVRGLNRKSLPKICVEDDLVAQLEKLSIDYENELLPYLNQSSKSIGSSSIHQDIEKAKKAKLCSVDTLKVLKESDWINFFANLTRTSS